MKNALIKSFIFPVFLFTVSIGFTDSMGMDIFAGVGAAWSDMRGGDFTGNDYFSHEGAELMIPQLNPGFGWNAVAGYSMYMFPGLFGNLLLRCQLSVTQSFHSGTYQSTPVNASSLMFCFDAMIGYHLFDWLEVYAGGGWLLPLSLWISDGALLGGGVTDTLVYTGIEGLEAVIGFHSTIFKGITIYGDAVYRLNEYSNASYADYTLLPTEYFNTAAWNFRFGIMLKKWIS